MAGFKVHHKPRFSRTITVPVIEGEPAETFGATFVLQPSSALANLSTDEGQLEFLRAAVVDLRDIEGDDGAKLPFSPELLELVIDRFDCRAGLAAEYTRGLAELAPKN